LSVFKPAGAFDWVKDLYKDKRPSVGSAHQVSYELAREKD